MNKKALQVEYPRIDGRTKVAWFRPSPPLIFADAEQERRLLVCRFYRPALRAFYTPHRHLTTNRGEAIRIFTHAEHFVIRIQEDWLAMAKKDMVQITKWVNYRLSDDDKKMLAEEPLTMEQVIQEFATRVYAGYRLSVAYDDYSAAMQASLVCVDKDSPDAGIGVSSRHPDLDWALRSLLYKLMVVGDGKWSEFVDGPRGDSWS
jgi:hypothetical protein